MNEMIKRLVGPNLNIVFPTLVTVGIIIAAISVIDSKLLFNKAFAQNATNQTTAN
jgi:hypothetical protein